MCDCSSIPGFSFLNKEVSSLNKEIWSSMTQNDGSGSCRSCRRSVVVYTTDSTGAVTAACTHVQCSCRLYHLRWLFMALSQSWELFCMCLIMRRNYFVGMLYQMLPPAVLIQVPKLPLAVWHSNRFCTFRSKFFHRQWPKLYIESMINSFSGVLCSPVYQKCNGTYIFFVADLLSLFLSIITQTSFDLH